MGTSSAFVENPGPLLTPNPPLGLCPLTVYPSSAPDVLDPYKLAADEYQRSFNQDWQKFLDLFKSKSEVDDPGQASFLTVSVVRSGQDAMIPPPLGNEEELGFGVVVPEAAAAGPVEDFNVLFPDT